MIRGFADADTAALFKRKHVRRFQSIERAAYRRLVFLDQAPSLRDFKGPGFQLERLKDDRAGQYAIRVNEQYRICFVWRDGDAHDVEIVDYY